MIWTIIAWFLELSGAAFWLFIFGLWLSVPDYPSVIRSQQEHDRKRAAKEAATP